MAHPTPPSGAHDSKLSDLWKDAVERYIEIARLNDAEKAELGKRTAPRDAFDLVKNGWDKNVVERRGKKHAVIEQTVAQVLGVFDVVDAALGFAAAVHFHKYLV
jgi:hypothetical protein